MEALGRLWVTGIKVKWAALHEGSRRRRVPLPTYPFNGSDTGWNARPRAWR